MNNKNDVETSKFYSILNSHEKHNMSPNVFIFRDSKPIIVVVISLYYLCLSSNIDKSFGDRLTIQSFNNVDKSDDIWRKITPRKYRDTNNKEYMESLQSSQRLNKCEESVDELVAAYNKGVQSIVNHLAKNYYYGTRLSLVHIYA